MKIVILAGLILLFTSSCEDESLHPADPVISYEFTDANLDEFGESLLIDMKMATDTDGSFENFDDAKDRQRNSQALDIVDHYFSEVYESQWAGSILSMDGDGILYIKGEMTAEMYQKLAQLSPIQQIQVIDQQQFSKQELQERKTLTVQFLEDNGYELGAGIDVEHNQVHAFVKEKDSHSSHSLRATLPQELQDNVSFEMNAPVFTKQKAHGGMATNSCTFGFAVEQISDPSIKGISTAGHCVGIEQITHQDSAHDVTLQDYVDDASGDVAWYTIDDETVDLSAKVYYTRWSDRKIKDVYKTKYQRAGTRVCNFSVQSGPACANIWLADFDGCGTGQMVMDANISAPGDSGAPYFYGEKAYGMHVGICTLNNDDHSVYTPAETLELIGVRVWEY